MISRPQLARATLVGTLRNGAKYIQEDIPNLIELLSQIFDLTIIIVESDSDDDTVKLLMGLREKYPNMDVKTFGNLRDSIPDRVDRIRFCRNYYVKELRENQKFSESEYIVVADLDGVNNKLKFDSIRKALASNRPWDCLAANQSAPYYDLFALRHPTMMPGNFLDELEGLTRSESVKMKKKILWPRMIRIPKDANLISVESAFGGFAIYKRWVFEKFDYGILGESRECEHVHLNRSATTSGAQFFIAPYLVNSSWNEHSLSKYFLFRFIYHARNFFAKLHKKFS